MFLRLALGLGKTNGSRRAVSAMLILGVEMDEGGRTTSSKVALAPGVVLFRPSPRVARVRRLSTEHWTRFMPCDMLLARLPGVSNEDLTRFIPCDMLLLRLPGRLLEIWSLLTECVSVEREWDVADLGILVELGDRRVAARSISIEVVGMLPRRWCWEARRP